MYELSEFVLTQNFAESTRRDSIIDLISFNFKMEESSNLLPEEIKATKVISKSGLGLLQKWIHYLNLIICVIEMVQYFCFNSKYLCLNSLILYWPVDLWWNFGIH